MSLVDPEVDPARLLHPERFRLYSIAAQRNVDGDIVGLQFILETCGQLARYDVNGRITWSFHSVSLVKSNHGNSDHAIWLGFHRLTHMDQRDGTAATCVEAYVLVYAVWLGIE